MNALWKAAGWTAARTGQTVEDAYCMLLAFTMVGTCVAIFSLIYYPTHP